jgi:hypothetical protein
MDPPTEKTTKRSSRGKEVPVTLKGALRVRTSNLGITAQYPRGDFVRLALDIIIL